MKIKAKITLNPEFEFEIKTIDPNMSKDEMNDRIFEYIYAEAVENIIVDWEVVDE